MQCSKLNSSMTRHAILSSSGKERTHAQTSIVRPLSYLWCSSQNSGALRSGPHVDRRFAALEAIENSSIQSRGSFNPRSTYQKRSPNRAEPYPNATTIDKNIGTVTASG